LYSYSFFSNKRTIKYSSFAKITLRIFIKFTGVELRFLQNYLGFSDTQSDFFYEALFENKSSLKPDKQFLILHSESLSDLFFKKIRPITLANFIIQIFSKYKKSAHSEYRNGRIGSHRIKINKEED